MPENPNEKPGGKGDASPKEDASTKEETSAKGKRPRNIVTDFYDSLNISVRQLDIALVVLCAFILIVIVLAARTGA